MSRQIMDYITSYSLLSPLQSGFRCGHSCRTAALKVLDDIIHEYDVGNVSLMCFLDFSKAFDRVNHTLLCHKLKYYFGFTDSSLLLVKNYLSGRIQKVIIGDKESGFNGVTSGVPQGSVLGPLLFSVFINDIFGICRNSRMHAYADDLVLYLSNRVGLLEDTCYKLNEDLCALDDWSKLNRLTLNPSKSFVLPVSRTGIGTEELATTYLGDTALQYVEKVKYLGFYINSRLSCNDHINNVVRKVFLTLRNWRVSSSFIPTELKRRLVMQLVLPLMTYSAEVYSKLDSISMHKLQVSFNNATRFIYGLGRFDGVSSWRKEFLGCDLGDYLCIRNLMFLHSLLNGRTPRYLYEKLVFGSSTRCMTLVIPRYRHLNTSRFFFVNAIKLWNSLPINIKLIMRKNSFKKALLHLYM